MKKIALIFLFCLGIAAFLPGQQLEIMIDGLFYDICKINTSK